MTTRNQRLSILPAAALILTLILTITGTVTPDQAAVAYLVLCVATGWGFCLIYTVVARWWRTPEGRSEFGLYAVISLILTYVLSAIVAGEYVGRDLFRLLTYGAVFLAMQYGVSLLLLAQIDAHRARRSARDKENR